MEVVKNLGYDVKSRNDCFEAIYNIVNHNYVDALKCSDELLIAISLSYFILSKEDIVSTDKNNPNINAKHTPIVDTYYLFNFFNNSPVKSKFSHYTDSAIIAIIRNALCHGGARVDFDRKVVNINTTYGDLDIDEEIPFSFFTSYLKEKLSGKKDMSNSSITLFTAYKNPLRYNFFSPEVPFFKILAFNGIVPLKFNAVSANGNPIDSDSLKQFVLDCEFVFRNNFCNKFEDFNDYYNKFVEVVTPVFSERFPGAYLNISVGDAFEEAEIFHAFNSYISKYRSNFDASTLCSNLNTVLFNLDGGVINFLPGFYKAISNFQGLKDFYGDFVYMPLSEAGDKGNDSKIKTVLMDASTLKVHDTLGITSLLYVLGTNAILVNDDSLKSFPDAGLPDSFLFYSLYNSNEDEDKINSNTDAIYKKRNLIAQNNERLNNTLDTMARSRILATISDIQREIEILIRENEMAKKRLNSTQRRVNPYGGNDFDSNISIVDGNTRLIYTDSTFTINTIIRNAFAHPGRVKVVYDEKEDEYNVEIIDVNDNGIITGRGYASLNDFLFYLTKGSRLYEEKSLRSA